MTTSLRCCTNFIRCWSRDEWSVMACPQQSLLQSRVLQSRMRRCSTVRLCSRRWCGQPCDFLACGFVTRCDLWQGCVLQSLKIACLVHQSLASTAPTYNCLQTFILPPSMVVISAHLHTDHALFHGPLPLSATEASLSQDRACGTVCQLL